MEVSHTSDGYWVLSGYIDPEYEEGLEPDYEDTQVTIAKAKEQFIKANPLIDPAKVVVVNGEFKQASFKQPTLGDMARTDECRSLTHDMIEVMTNQANMKEMLGQS